MKLAFLYYDGFAEFEIVFISQILRKQELVFTALENRIYESEERQKYQIDLTLDKIKAEDYDALIIPGGDPKPLFENPTLVNCIKEFNDQGKLIAGICGGTVLMAGLGLLDGKSCTGNASGILETDADFKYFKNAKINNANVVLDGNIMTAQGQAFAEFAVEVSKYLGYYKNDDEYICDLNWIKNIRN